MFNSISGGANMVTPTKLIKLPEVIDRTAKSRSKIWADIKAGKFPKPIKIGPRAIAFIESEIEAQIQIYIEASRPGNPEGDSDEE